MAFRNKTNLGYSAVATAPSPAASGTTLTVTAGHGARFPASNFVVTVWAATEIPTPTNAEILLVATRTGDVFSGITRATGGTSARTILVGDQVANTVTAEQLTDIETSIPSTLGLLSAINVSAGVLAQNLSALTFSNANGVSFGLAGSVITGTVGTNYQAPGAYLTTAALSQDSSKYAGTNGAITGGSITVNTSGVSVNLPAYLSTQSTQFQALTLGGNTSGTTTFHATNNASLFFDGGNNVTLSGNGSTVTISAANQSVQTQNLIAASLSGNTAGALALVSSGTIIFAGGNNITLSQNGQSVTISGANAGGAQTGISGIAASNTTYTSGSVTFTGVGGGVTVSSNTGQRIDISVAAPVAQTVQTQNLHNLSLSGNTAGVLAQISSGTAILAGGNNITLSQNGQSITISGANAGGAQTGISGIIVSDATYSSGTVSFSNAGNITISSSVNGATQFIRLSGNAAQTNQSAIKGFGVSNTGQTAGNTGISSGIDWVMAGSGSITLSQSTAGGGPNTVWVQHPAWITTATQSSMSVSDAATSGTLARLAFTNLNGVTLSLSTGAAGSHTIVGSHNAITSQSTQFLALTLGGNTAGTTTFHATNNASLFFHGGNNITLSGNGSSVTISGPNVGGAQTGISGIVVSDTTYTSGTVSFSNAGNITISSSVNGATQYIKLSGNAAQTVQTQSLIQAIYDGANSISTGTIRFTNANGVSFSINGQTLSGSVAAQTNQTIGGYAVGNTTGQSSSSTFDARTLSFNGAGNISVGYSNSSIIISGASAAPSPVNFSAGTTSGNLGSVVFSDSNGVSFGINGSTITATVSTYSTIGTATTVYPVASANSVGTVTRWAAEDHRHAGVGGIGISTSGNTAGTTGSVQGTYWFQGGNNITVSQITSNNGSHTLVISGNGGLTNINVSAGTTSNNLSAVTWANSNGVSFGLNASTMTGSVAQPGTLSMWPVVLPATTALSTYYSGSTSQGAGGGSTQTGYTFSLYAVPMPVPAYLGFSELRLGISNSRSTASTGSITQMYSAGIYSNNASTLSLVQGYYGGILFTQNSITSQVWSVFTASTGSNSVGAGAFAGIQKASIYSSQGNISANSQMEPGVKWLLLGNGTSTMVSEGQYYFVLGFASASSGGNIYANVGILQSNALSTGPIADLGRENSTQTSNYLPAWGAISTTFTSVSNAATFFPLPNAIAISNLTMSNSSGERYHFPLLRNHS